LNTYLLFVEQNISVWQKQKDRLYTGYDQEYFIMQQ